MEKKRFNNISLLRIVAILAVFVFHILHPLSLTEGKQYFPLYFGVQIFLFISGFLYAFKDIKSYKDFYAKNITKIVLPTILYAFLCLITAGLFSAFTKTSFSSFFFYTNAAGNPLTNYGHLWYIPAILLCYLCLPFLKNLNKKSSLIFLSLFATLDIFTMTMFEIQIVFLPFFVGFMFYKFTQSHNYQKSKKWILLVCALMFAGAGLVYAIVYNSTYLATNLPHTRYLIKEVMAGLLAISFSVMFYEAFAFTNKSGEPLPNTAYFTFCKILKYTDKYIFPFFFMHSFVIISGVGFMLHISPYVAINIILILNMAIIATVIFQMFIDFFTKKLPWMKKK